MNSCILSWDDLWIYHRHAAAYIQEDILRQLDLENYLPRVTVQVRAEVMKSAPLELREQIEKTIPLTKGEEEYRKYLTQMFGGK